MPLSKKAKAARSKFTKAAKSRTGKVGTQAAKRGGNRKKK
jgi:hypothetical protein